MKLQYLLFTIFKLPSVWLMGIRVKSISEKSATVKVKHRWINQNPFNSMFWAVQGMAAELATGVLLTSAIRESGAKISMLVLNNKANFSKKATGRIRFQCDQGLEVKAAVAKTVETGASQTIWMDATGIDEQGDVVSHFSFEWTLLKK